MRRRLFIVLVALALLSAGVSIVIWGCARWNPLTMSDFARGERRWALGGGFIYVNSHPPPDAATVAIIAQMDRIERDPVARRGAANSNWFSSSGSGDFLIFVGWNVETRTRTVGPYTAVVDRSKVYWISPWLGVMPALLVAAWLLPATWWRGRIARRRLLARQCAYCGYDLRATPERCPECGRAAVAG